MAVTIDLTGRVALVTGGTRGVGRGIADRLAEGGATMVVAARSPVGDLPSGWGFVAADLRDGDQAAAAVDAAYALHGRLDIVVNNAGGSPPIDTATAEFRRHERVIALNLLAPLYVSIRANHWMQQGAGGSIINIGSVCGSRPSPTVAAYGAAKAGLINLTMTMAMEFAPKVRVNCVSCGLIHTDRAGLHYGDEAGIARVAATVPNGRLADPTEIGDVCLWLASDRASYVSGANVSAHGGGERPPFLDAAG
jgi:NAD(P)-dependent dehydrogenase (short-subunit alcohol dehydrogenase family)